MVDCLRCGYCCFCLCVIIVDNPEKGLSKDNLIPHNFNIDGKRERCKHIIGNKPGEYSCAIHHYEWYKKTPCYSHNSELKECRMGKYITALENHTWET